MADELLAVGFDLDYTLWDQGRFVLSFLGSIAEELGGRAGCPPDHAERVLRETLGNLGAGHPALFDAALTALGLEDPALVADLVERYHRHRPPMHPYPEAIPVLDRLRSKGTRLFLVTDGRSDTQRYKVEALGLAPWFEERVFTGDFPRLLHKPSPFPFLLACRRLRLRPGQCAFVGDNPLCDFEGPRRLGMLTLGVGTGPYAGLDVPLRRSPHHRVADLSGLGRYL